MRKNHPQIARIQILLPNTKNMKSTYRMKECKWENRITNATTRFLTKNCGILKQKVVLQTLQIFPRFIVFFFPSCIGVYIVKFDFPHIWFQFHRLFLIRIFCFDFLHFITVTRARTHTHYHIYDWQNLFCCRRVSNDYFQFTSRLVQPVLLFVLVKLFVV